MLREEVFLSGISQDIFLSATLASEMMIIITIYQRRSSDRPCPQSISHIAVKEKKRLDPENIKLTSNVSKCALGIKYIELFFFPCLLPTYTADEIILDLGYDG